MLHSFVKTMSRDGEQLCLRVADESCIFTDGWSFHAGWPIFTPMIDADDLVYARFMRMLGAAPCSLPLIRNILKQDNSEFYLEIITELALIIIVLLE